MTHLVFFPAGVARLPGLRNTENLFAWVCSRTLADGGSGSRDTSSGWTLVDFPFAITPVAHGYHVNGPACSACGQKHVSWEGSVSAGDVAGLQQAIVGLIRPPPPGTAVPVCPMEYVVAAVTEGRELSAGDRVATQARLASGVRYGPCHVMMLRSTSTMHLNAPKALPT